MGCSVWAKHTQFSIRTILYCLLPQQGLAGEDEQQQNEWLYGHKQFVGTTIWKAFVSPFLWCVTSFSNLFPTFLRPPQLQRRRSYLVRPAPFKTWTLGWSLLRVCLSWERQAGSVSRAAVEHISSVPLFRFTDVYAYLEKKKSVSLKHFPQDADGVDEAGTSSDFQRLQTALVRLWAQSNGQTTPSIASHAAGWPGWNRTEF